MSFTTRRETQGRRAERMTSKRTSISRGNPPFDPQANEQSTQEAASSDTIAPSTRNESELNPLESLQRTRRERSADDNTSLRPSLPTSRFAPASSPPPGQVTKRPAANRIVGEGLLSALSDGTKSLQEISQSNNLRLKNFIRTDGSLTDRGEKSLAHLSNDQRELFDAASAKRRQTLSDGARAKSQGAVTGSTIRRGGSAGSGENKVPSIALRLVDTKFLSDVSDGRKSLREIGRLNDFSSLRIYLQADGSLTDKGKKNLAHLSSEQRAQFDAASAKRQETLSDKVRGYIEGAQWRESMRSGAGSSSHQSSSLEDLISRSSGGATSSSHQMPPNDVISQLMSTLPQHAGGSAPALGGDDSSPRGLTPYQNQFMPSPAAGSSPSLHGQEVDSRWSGAAQSRTPGESSVSRHSTLDSPTFGGLGGLAPIMGNLPTPSHSRGTYPSAQGLEPFTRSGGIPSQYSGRSHARPGSSSHQPSPQDDLISLLRVAQPAQRSERSIPASSVFPGLPTLGASFVLPEESHASSTRPAATSPDLSSLRSEIPEDSFRVVVEGLSLTDHINNLADLGAYSNVSAASLKRLVFEQTASDGSTRLQLSSLGEAYLNQFVSEEQRHTLSRASTTRSKRRQRDAADAAD
jgi:hypothetical protein